MNVQPQLGGLMSANWRLCREHYLGPTRRASLVWDDEYGVMIFANPTARALPVNNWLELTRWCLSGESNAGSQQWRRFINWARAGLPDITTLVSYSDPSVGHTGALYRACNWLWALTWHRLRPPPTGNGSWSADIQQSIKDRWIYPLRPDQRRTALLAIQDESVKRQMPWSEYREPKWRRGRPQLASGGGDYKRFAASEHFVKVPEGKT